MELIIGDSVIPRKYNTLFYEFSKDFLGIITDIKIGVNRVLSISIVRGTILVSAAGTIKLLGTRDKAIYIMDTYFKINENYSIWN